MLIAFNKPYGVISQFTPDGSANRMLSDFAFPKDVYPIGRLDADSEGLMLLSDEPQLNERLLHPRHSHAREYWVQVERVPTCDALRLLEQGVVVQGHKALPCHAWILEPQPQVLPAHVETSHQSAAEQSSGKMPGLCQDAATPKLPPRDPPIRFRKTVPTCWLGLELTEGKNRQIRHMTAVIGHPTLRLIRVKIGGFALHGLPVGKWIMLNQQARNLVLESVSSR